MQIRLWRKLVRRQQTYLVKEQLCVLICAFWRSPLVQDTRPHWRLTI